MSRSSIGWVILAAGFFILFFGGGSRFALGLMLKPMTEDLGWSRSTLSLAVTCFMFTSALALPLAGRLVDRYSLRWVLAAGALMVASGVGLMGVVTQPWQVFLVYGGLFALGHAATGNPIVGVMITRWFDRRRGIANSVAVSGNATGQLLIIGMLATFLTTTGWRTAYGLLAAANLLIALPLLFVALRSWATADTRVSPSGTVEGGPPVPTTTTAAISEEPPSVIASGQFWLLVVLYAVCGFQDFFMATHVVAFAQDSGIGTALAGNILALMGLMGLVGVLGAGLLSDARGAQRPLLLCFVLRIGIFALIIAAQNTATILVFSLLYGFTFLMTAPLTVIFSREIFGPARLGTVSGVISMVHQMFGGLGALAGALIFDYWGDYQPAFILMLVLSVAATALSPLLHRGGGSRAVAAA
ncbi:MAG: MFS transporter [Chloroflexi bacterium]|nr:MFS transporter [Chloroflexota bacterium]